MRSRVGGGTYHSRMTVGGVARRALSIAIAAVIAGCGVGDASPPPVRTGEPPTSRIPIVIDADFDHSDIAAIAVLLRDPAVEVRAITIAGTGLVHCRAGRLVTRYLLDELGSPDIPFGCGREVGGPDARPFPDAWRARADAAFGMDIPPQVEAGVPREAAELLASTIDASPSAPTIVTLGPLTNLEDAFLANPSLPDRIAAIHAMLGTVGAPGNVFVDGLDDGDPLEWNALADPSAVAAVFAADVPISIVPLDATDDVPVPGDLAERLAIDHQAGGADLVYELLLRNPDRMRSEDGQQLWDELAALTLTDPDLAAWEEATFSVGADGRLIADEAGRSIRHATTADRAAVERSLLVALRRGEPRATPFRAAGSLAVVFDGTTCTARGSSDEPGFHEVRYQGPAGTASGLVIAGTLAPHRWDELLDLLPTLDLEVTPPDWIVTTAAASDEAGTGEPVATSGDLADGIHGPICLTGTWPDVTFTPGVPFQAGGGVVGAAQ